MTLNLRVCYYCFEKCSIYIQLLRNLKQGGSQNPEGILGMITSSAHASHCHASMVPADTELWNKACQRPSCLCTLHVCIFPFPGNLDLG